jgi:hypothetical protein
MAIDPLSIGVAAGVSALSPVVAKGIGSLFGLDQPSEEERQAEQLRQQALDRLTAQAEGRTASPAQLAAIAQQQRTQQALQSLAQRGSVQQRAGNLRTAMQAAPEVMAQQGAIAAQTRAQEMESARNALAQMQMASAAQQAASGRQNREYMQRIVGAGVSGAGAIAGQGMLMGAEDAAKKTATTSQAQTAAPTTQANPVVAAPSPTVQQQPSSVNLTATPLQMQMAESQKPKVFSTSLKQPNFQLGARARNALYGTPEAADVFDMQLTLGNPYLNRT